MALMFILCAVIMTISNGNKDRRHTLSLFYRLSSQRNNTNIFRYLEQRTLVTRADDDRVKQGNNKEDDEEESELLLCPVLIEM